MTTLGQAYVQIMPSAKGISGSIKSILDPEATSAGKSVGTQITKSIADTMSGLGKELTKYITIPAMGAMTAITGMVGALGFKRLIGMDNAQAKLKGLGIEGKQLEQVMLDAKNAVMGTTYTMADGAYTAAGALAAGVKEGKDLERYIKLVGDAATGAEVPMQEMAQIFNRVTSEGKLTGHELEMINYRLPGFSNAMMKHVGAGSRDAFNQMLRSGKVSTDDMLDVMEDFAGGMAKAFAGTWQGIISNIFANIGIIGEGLLKGVFDLSKEQLGEFLQLLRESEGLKKWAAEMGERLKGAMQGVVEAIKGAIDWWINLDDGIKNVITTIAGFAIAAGPILMVLGKIVGLITPAITLFQTLGTVIYGLLSPVGLVIAAIVGGAALVIMHWEPISEFFAELWQGIYEIVEPIVQAISDFVMEIFGTLTEWWNENSELMREVAETVWNAIGEVVSNVMETIVPIVEVAWGTIQRIVETVWGIIKTIVTTTLNIILGIVKTIMQLITGDWSGAWSTVKETVSTLLSGARDLIKSILSGAFNIVTGLLGDILGKFKEIFGNVKDAVVDKITGVKDSIEEGINNALDFVLGIGGKFVDAGKNIVTSIADGIKGAISIVTDAISNVTQKIRDFLPFSPPKTGPLMDIMDVKWGETISSGIVKGESIVADAMDSLLSPRMNFKDSSGMISGQQINNDYQITIHATIEEEQDIEKLVKQIDDYLVKKERQHGVVRIR